MWRSAVQVCLGLLLITSQEAEVGHILPRATSGGLAQLARASALQAEGQRFESVILHHFPKPYAGPQGHDGSGGRKSAI